MQFSKKPWREGEGESTLVNIRDEKPEDIGAIRSLNVMAFGQPQEANLIEALRTNCGVLLSLVATIDGQVVGHVLYSPVSIGSDEKKVVGAGLGPMAVLPEHQRRGIGTKLIELGNKRLKENRCPFIVVLGHPEYYPRFGFKPASCCGIKCEWDVPDNVFMVLVLDEEKMRGVSGLARYRAEFSNVA